MEEGISRDGGSTDRPRRPHHATVVAWLALFVALGGLASALPGRNAVGSKDIRKGAVRASDIRTQAVRSSEIRNGGVRSEDIAAAAIGEEQLLDGAVTPGKLGTTPAARVFVPQEPPGCAAQVIEDGPGAMVQFSLEEFDTQDLHEDPPLDCSAATQSRLTAPIGGIYVVSVGLSWDSSSVGRRQLEILQTDAGGTTTMAADHTPGSSGGGTVQGLSTIVSLSAGDHVEVRAAQNSGDPLELGNGSNTYLSMSWLGPPPG